MNRYAWNRGLGKCADVYDRGEGGGDKDVRTEKKGDEEVLGRFGPRVAYVTKSHKSSLD